jgi:hypothetical protein
MRAPSGVLTHVRGLARREVVAVKATLSYALDLLEVVREVSKGGESANQA